MTTMTAPNAATDRRHVDWFEHSSRIISTVLVLLVSIPLLMMLWRLFVVDGRLNLTGFTKLAAQPWLGTMLVDTLITVAVSVVIALFVGSMFAWFTERTNAQIGWLSRILPVLPLFVPPLASAIGWVLLGTPGPGVLNVLLRPFTGGGDGPVDIFTWPGIIFLFTISLIPHVYLVVTAALRNLEPSLEEASRISGVGPIATLFKITLPAIRPSLISGALLAMAAGFSLFSVPFLVGSQAGIDNLIVRVVRMTTHGFPPELDQASVLGLVVVFFIGGSWLLQRQAGKQARHARMEGKTSSPTLVDLGWFKWIARGLTVAFILLSAVLPLVALVYVSLQSFWSGQLTTANFTLRNYAQLLDPRGTTFEALRNSILLGVVTALVAIVVATIIAYFGERRPRSIIARAADGVIKLPAALSHVVIALALIIAFSGPPFALQGTLVLLFLGYLIMYLPQASVNANSALSQLGPALTEASLVSGASEMRTFFKIVFPLMGPGLVAGWVMVFVMAAGDLTASAMLSSPRSPVVGFVMLDLATSGTYGSVAALGAVITLVTSVVGGLVLLFGQRLGKGRGTRIRPTRLARRAATTDAGVTQ